MLSGDDPHFESAVVGELETTLLGAVDAGVGVYGADGIIGYANEAYANLLETRRETLEGTHVTRTNPEFERSRFDDYWDSFTDGERRTRETVHRTIGGGEEMPVEVTTRRTTVEGVRCNVCTVRDISQRVECERERRVYREAVEQTTHAVVVTDSDGTIEYVNPAFEDVTGYDRSEAIGNTPRILNSGKESEQFYDHLWETITSGNVWEAELVNRRKSDELYYVDQRIAPVTDDDGEITHFVSTEDDVTEQKLRAKRLSELNRILRHNLRNAVTVLKSQMGRIQDELDRIEDEVSVSAVMDRIDTLEATSEKASQIRTVLGRDSAVDAACNLGSVLETVATDARERYPSADVRVDSESVTVAIDRKTCQALVEELVNNAVVHNDQPTPVVELSVEPPGPGEPQASVRIADDGPGIPDEEKTAVELGPEQPLRHGSGIGLAHVHAVATAFGGDVDIQSNDPRGSVVTLSVPAVPEPAPETT